MRILLLFLLLVTGVLQAQELPAIIPQPARVQPGQGYFNMPQKITIVTLHNKLSKEAQYLQMALKENFGINASIAVTSSATSALKKNNIYLQTFAGMPGKEAYQLNVNTNGVSITGNSATGLFRGLQTLLQMLMPSSESAGYAIPCATINDEARFAYRGMHLDVCRHFFPVSFVKKYIDYLAFYKFNTFHWHLTEDQGWRIEIKKYPLLTKAGGFRNGTIIGRYPGTGNDSIQYGGYYTQQQIKEIVQYATDRHITVIPEIEMPGHASAALTAYPQLGCTGGPYHVQQTWGVFEDVFCAGNDATFNFLQDVLDEVIPLFPSKYIHIGGDECPKESWKKCPKCQQRMKDKGLKDEHALQSYFIQRIEKYLNSKGRNIIGWDEILEGGLAPNATVMSWRGEEGGIEAAKQQHNVIMTPGSHCYLDHSQSRNEDSVTIGGYTPLEKVYAYEPVPAALTPEQAKYVLGAQGNVWTEYMKYPSKVEYMIFPRMLALSEVLWSPKEKRNWDDFSPRMQQHLGILKSKGINFSKAYFDLVVQIKRAAQAGTLKINLKPRQKNGLIRHVITSLPARANYVPAEELLLLNQDGESIVPISASGLHIFNWFTGNGSSRPAVFDFSFNKATAQNITLTTPPSKQYAGEDGANGLVNGLQSKKGIASPEWLGWVGSDLEAVIDLGSVQDVAKVSVHTLDQNGSWIYLPPAATVTVSTDGQNFTAAAQGGTYADDAVHMKYLHLAFNPVKTRYIKILVKNYGDIPTGKPGAGNKAWLFVDELRVE
jgi:hexosaminidase